MNNERITEGVVDLARSIGLPDYNPKQVDPALLTFKEYYHIVNKDDKSHPSNAYDSDLTGLNRYGPAKSAYRIVRQFRRHGLSFDLGVLREKIGPRVKIDPETHLPVRLNGQLVHYTDEEIALLGYPTHEWSLAVFEADKVVARVQDEWGCVLVVVAKEYRGFGLGPLLVKYARSIEPTKPSGGFTPGGFRNFARVYREFVMDALRSGYYRQLIDQGSLSVARVKEIVASAKMYANSQPSTDEINLSDDPADYLLYVGEYGDFIVYDRKLISVLKEGDRAEFFAERMIKGIAYVSIQGVKEEYAMLRVFGGDTPALKRLLMTCAIEYSRQHKMSLYLEADEPPFVDPTMATVDPKITVRPGFRSQRAIPTGKRFDYAPMGRAEAHWRHSVDRYHEFRNQMVEMAYAKFRQ